MTASEATPEPRECISQEIIRASAQREAKANAVIERALAAWEIEVRRAFDMRREPDP